MRMVRTMLALVVCVALASTLSAAEQKQRRAPEGARGPTSFAARVEMMIRNLDLTDAQKSQLEEIKKEFGAELKAAQEKIDSVLTDDQKKARAEAMQKVRESREGWQNLRETLEKAMNLTDAQKKDMEAARTASMELNRELMQKVMSVLTTEQKEALEKARRERGQRGGQERGQRRGSNQ